MADYRVGIGYNIAYASTAKIEPEPTGDPVAPVERNYGVSGIHYDRGGFVKFHWDMIESPAVYQSMLTLFDLVSNETAEVTIHCRNGLLYSRKYNGIAHRPEPGVDMKWERFFLRDVNVYVTDLVEIAEP